MYRTSTNMLILTFAVLCLTATFVLAQTGGARGISARIRLGFLDNTSLCSNWWLRLLAFIPAIEYGDRLGRQLL
jgi:hypothetical protein